MTTKAYSSTLASIASKGSQTLTFSTSISGYKPIGIIAISKTGAGSGYIFPAAQWAEPSNNQCKVTLYNAHTAALSNIGVTITALFVSTQ